MATDAVVRARFWAKVDKHKFGTKCWMWTGARTPAGYGVLLVRGRRWLAHRFSFALKHGTESLGDDHLVAHVCQVRACVRPDHLRQRDRAAQPKVRPRGAAPKLTAAAVREIRSVATTLEGECAMMLKHGISQSYLKSVVQRKYWRHVR